MNITEAEVMDLIAQRALKARRYAGWGQLEVRPAITNVEPRKRACEAQDRGGQAADLRLPV